MKKASEYRLHAEDCIKLARQADSAHQRDLLLRMAADWEEMARYRAKLIELHPELARPGEREEEDAPRPPSAR